MKCQSFDNFFQQAYVKAGKMKIPKVPKYHSEIPAASKQLNYGN